MPPANYDLSSFDQDHFGAAELGDQRRTKSLVDLANRLAKHPSGSLPDKFKDPNALRRCYDLMNTQTVTHATVLQPHIQHTAQRLLTHRGVALCLHDTTQLDFTSHTSLHYQLGQIGDGNGRGYECHNSLVVLPKGREVLGLLAQQLHHRADVPEGETPAQRREREDRESLLWPQGAEAAQQAVQQVCAERGLSELPEGVLLVDVFDRGGDNFEFLDHLDEQNRRYVGRAKHNRRIRIGHAEDGKESKLQEHLRSLPRQGVSRQITVRSHEGEASREATVVQSWAAVQLLPPKQKSGHSRRQPLAVWAVRVWEPNPPEGVKAVEWFLLTRVAVLTAPDAWERVDWYCTRWVVEEYHKAQKTGCSIESPQFETVQALEPMIALLSVIAITLLNLRAMSRDPSQQDQPATKVVSSEEEEVLSGWRYGQSRALTIKKFFFALARLGGHQNRRKDHPPGWLVLWRGWQALQLMVAGARTVRSRPSVPL